MKLLEVFVLALAFAGKARGNEGVRLQNVIQLPIFTNKLASSHESLNSAILERRADSLDLGLDDKLTYYSVNVSLGSPPQPLSLILDTGSSDTWVRGCSSWCYHDSFRTDASSTFKMNETKFNISYLDGSRARGTWGQDLMHLGEAELTSFNFAVTDGGEESAGVAGIGLPLNETPFIEDDIPLPYMNLPQQLKRQGFIQRAAYSLWLSDRVYYGGHILFGGIDHAKYKSDMYVVPLVPSGNSSKITQLAVKLTGLSIYDNNGNEQPFAACELPVILDSGSTVSILPIEVMRPLLDLVGATIDVNGQVVLPHYCGGFESKQGIGLQISGLNIRLPFEDIEVDVEQDHREACLPGFLPDYGLDVGIIGDNILRALYVVYDLDTLEVGLAAAITNGERALSTPSIEALSTGIPGKKASSDTRVGLGYVTAPITLINNTMTTRARQSTPTAVRSNRSRSRSTIPAPRLTLASSRLSIPSTVRETNVIEQATDTALRHAVSTAAALVGFIVWLL